MAKSKVSQHHLRSKSHGSIAETGQEKVPLKRPLSSPELSAKRLKTGKPVAKKNLDPKGVLAPLRANAKVARNLLRDRDFSLDNQGSIVLLIPHSDAAREWVNEHIGQSNGFQPYWPTVVIEHRYVSEIISAAQRDGLRVQGVQS
jgi:hypothetical protein